MLSSLTLLGVASLFMPSEIPLDADEVGVCLDYEHNYAYHFREDPVVENKAKPVAPQPPPQTQPPPPNRQPSPDVKMGRKVKENPMPGVRDVDMDISTLAGLEDLDNKTPLSMVGQSKDMSSLDLNDIING